MGLTAEKIVKELNNYQVNELKDGYYNKTQLTKTLQMIFESLNIKSDEKAINTYVELKKQSAQKITL
jgi:hypothetical protein